MNKQKLSSDILRFIVKIPNPDEEIDPKEIAADMEMKLKNYGYIHIKIRPKEEVYYEKEND